MNKFGAAESSFSSLRRLPQISAEASTNQQEVHKHLASKGYTQQTVGAPNGKTKWTKKEKNAHHVVTVDGAGNWNHAAFAHSKGSTISQLSTISAGALTYSNGITIRQLTLALKNSIDAATHEHHAGEFPEQDRVVTELKRQGFKHAPGGYSRAPGNPMFLEKYNKIAGDQKGMAVRENGHLVMVNTDGSWTHTAHLMHDGKGPQGLKNLKSIMNASASPIIEGKKLSTLLALLASVEKNKFAKLPKAKKIGKPGSPIVAGTKTPQICPKCKQSPCVCNKQQKQQSKKKRNGPGTPGVPDDSVDEYSAKRRKK